MRKIVLWCLSVAAALALGLIIIPPMVTLDNLKPQIQAAILTQTGLHADITGHVRLSMLGRATLSANDVVIREYAGGGRVGYIDFSVPLYKIFNLKNAPLPDEIVIGNAELTVTTLATPDVDKTLIIRNSAVTFMGHRYGDINGVLRNGMFTGTLRTKTHKYTFDIDHEKFVIKNPNVNLTVRGVLATDNLGRISSNGTLEIETDDINDWFAFDVPRFDRTVTLSMKYDWRDKDFRFYDIVGTMDDAAFNGEITLSETGKKIKLTAHNLTYDAQFLWENPGFLKNADIDVDLYGKFDFLKRSFSHVTLKTVGDDRGIRVDNLEFSGKNLSGRLTGLIDGDGAVLNVDLIHEDRTLHCDFAGNADYWECRNWRLTTGDTTAHGTLTLTPSAYTIAITSDDMMPGTSMLEQLRTYFGTRDGNISFDFDNMAGVVNTSGGDYTLHYVSPDATLMDTPAELDALLPNAMLTQRGALSITIMNDIPQKINFHTQGWTFDLDRGRFTLTHDDAVRLFRLYHPTAETAFLRDGIPVSLSGRYAAPYVSDFEIMLGEMTFAGLVNGKSVTLKTDVLDMDYLINPSYVADYEARRFLTAEPLTVPFTMPFTLTLSADYFRYGGNDYADFAYALKSSMQRMSITDKTRGHILVTIDKELARYKILVQINKFAFQGGILNRLAPLNVFDSVLTARAELSTFGITADDFWGNVSGDLDMTFDGGTLAGLGTDWFYANAHNITRLNMGDTVMTMLDGGTTELKTLRVAGTYADGNFQSVAPIDLRTRHTQIGGSLRVMGGVLTAHLDIILRGTSPMPDVVYLDILPDGRRDYSLFEISSKIDPDYLYNFITTHNRF